MLASVRAEDMSQVADVAAALHPEDVRMEIRIWLDQTDPPVGRLRLVREGGAPDAPEEHVVDFTGWLGLMRTLSEALGPNEASGQQGSHGTKAENRHDP